MKVLWFTNVPLPAMFRRAGNGESGYGGHWMMSLFERLVCEKDIEIGIATAFPGLKKCWFAEGGVNYYVIDQPKRFSAFSCRTRDLRMCHSIIEDFQPDIIHFHGSERFFGLVKVVDKVNIPAVVSMQGLLGPCSRFQNFFGALSPFDIVSATRLLELLAGLGMLWDYKRMFKAVRREKTIIQNVEALFGRTTWDRSFARLCNPEAVYHNVGEIMRPPFYGNRWKLQQCDKYSIIYTNAGHPRRGTEDLLGAVALLKNEFPDIRLRLAGTVSKRSGYGRFLRNLIVKLGIVDQVEFLGYLNDTEMLRELLCSHVFAITSYIENSPNSLAEAMLLGMPCIASYVGGIPSMVEYGKTGLLFPAGDIPLLTDSIRRVFMDDSLSGMLGDNAHSVAAERHAPALVVNQLLSAYRDLAGK